LLKIGFFATNFRKPYPDKILQAYVGRTQISCVKILALWAKGRKMAVKWCELCCNGYNELAFVYNGTFGQKR